MDVVVFLSLCLLCGTNLESTQLGMADDVHNFREVWRGLGGLTQPDYELIDHMPRELPLRTRTRVPQEE